MSILQRDKVVGAGVSVGALSYTSLLPSSSKLMINVESDDYAVLEERECGCPFGELGMSLHMRDIRSYEKLTSEGNHFLGADLFSLVDEVLPARFGGRPGDYQLAEEERGGLTAVSIVVRPPWGRWSTRGGRRRAGVPARHPAQPADGRGLGVFGDAARRPPRAAPDPQRQGSAAAHPRRRDREARDIAAAR